VEDVKTEGLTSAKENAPLVKCRECKQLLDDPDLKLFAGDSEDAVRIYRLNVATEKSWNLAIALEKPWSIIVEYQLGIWLI
jgi:hypothetical protein